MKEITVYDMARELGLNASTVSRALKNNPVINEATRRRVNEYALAVGYRSNTFARKLRAQKTNTIGVIVPRLDSDFMSACLAGMEEVASRKGYDLLITQSQESARKEEENSSVLFDKRVDGVLVSLTTEESDLAYFRRFEDKKVPVIFFDRVPDHCIQSCFGIDNEKMAWEVGRHLLRQGCRYLAHLTIPSHLGVYLNRKRGFIKALEEFGDIRYEIIYLEDLSLEDGKACAAQILDKNIDGIFAANDLVATGCLLELQNRGKIIPDDIAIVGFNNDQVASIVSPNLSTVDYRGRETGRKALENLLAILETGNANDTGFLLESELIIRGSSQRRDKQKELL